jgi:hypothetical protein
MSSVRGLNERPQTAKRLPFRSPPKWRSSLRNSSVFCAALTVSTAQQARVEAVGIGHRDQRLHVLGEARAAVADAGEEKCRADAAVEADAAADVLDVAAHGVAEVRDLVDQGDARRQHRVGGVLRHLGALRRHEQDWIAGAHERLVELFHDRAGAVAVVADDDAIRLWKSRSRRLLEELGIGDDVHRMRRAAADDLADARRGADRNGALVDDDFVVVHRVADLLRNLPHRRQVGSPLAPSGVPTAMKQIRDRRTASARSVWNVRRCCATLRLISSSRPGS